MTTTYNPILETVELRRVRIGAPLRGPAMGTALVLERAVGEPLVVEPGDRVPDARFGNYRRMHRVDTANRALSFTTSVPSADAAFPFTVTITLGCQVVDPVVVARDGIRDMTAALQPSITATIRPVAATHDVFNPIGAEAAIKAILDRHRSPSGLLLSGFSVTVEAADTAEILSANRELRVQSMKREAMRPVASGSREDMLAHVMGITGGDPTPVLDRERLDAENKTRASLDMLRVLMGSGNLEEVDTSRVTAEAMRTFFPGGPSLTEGTGGSIRDRLKRGVRGSLNAGGPVIDGDAKVEPQPQPDDSSKGEKTGSDEPPAPEAGGPRPSRLRGTANGAPRPTEGR
ncbi:MAG: hypothetical protein HOY78_28340 [Saccharothrix sp.]|nr:hypothetical protein [Saccharothrix sp.]